MRLVCATLLLYSILSFPIKRGVELPRYMETKDLYCFYGERSRILYIRVGLADDPSGWRGQQWGWDWIGRGEVKCG